MKTYSEGRIELRNLQFLKRMLEKSSQFLSLDQPNEPKSLYVPWVLQELKTTLGKLAIAVNLEAIRFEFWTERSVSDGGNLCSLWWGWFSNQFEIVSETPLSCDTVGCDLLWAVFYSLLCRETDWNIRIGKQGYVFILSDFKKRCFDVSHS